MDEDITANYQKLLIDRNSIKISGLSLYVNSVEKKSGILIDNSDLNITIGYRYGLVAPNGYGKSCLFKKLISDDIPLKKKLSIGYLNQNVVHSNKNIILEMLETNNTWLEEQELIEEGDPDKLDEFYNNNSEIHRLESDIKKMLSAVGFSQFDFKKKCSDFSGGWIMRMSLVKALVLEPDLLLLDEPTNHLDLDGVIWLENYLSKWNKSLIVVSHSRDFLDTVCQKIININNKQIINYNGNFTTYLKLIEIERKKKEKEYLENKKKIKSKKERKKIRPQSYRVNFNIDSYSDITKNTNMININNMSFNYENSETILKDINFGIFGNDRIAIVGPNGAGKTTFIRLLIGELPPTKGSININKNLGIAKYVQHFADLLPMNKTCVEYLQSEYNLPMEIARKYLGTFGIVSNAHNNLIKTCSGGQKSRIVLAGMCLQEPDIMVMDEPTNHLDMESIDSLIKLLKEFKGGVVIITHDIYLLEELGCTLYLCEDRSLKRFDGDIEDYKNYVLNKIVENNEVESKPINNNEIYQNNIEHVECKNGNEITLDIFLKRKKKKKRKNLFKKTALYSTLTHS